MWISRETSLVTPHQHLEKRQFSILIELDPLSSCVSSHQLLSILCHRNASETLLMTITVWNIGKLLITFCSCSQCLWSRITYYIQYCGPYKQITTLNLKTLAKDCSKSQTTVELMWASVIRGNIKALQSSELFFFEIRNFVLILFIKTVLNTGLIPNNKWKARKFQFWL